MIKIINYYDCTKNITLKHQRAPLSKSLLNGVARQESTYWHARICFNLVKYNKITSKKQLKLFKQFQVDIEQKVTAAESC